MPTYSGTTYNGATYSGATYSVAVVHARRPLDPSTNYLTNQTTN